MRGRIAAVISAAFRIVALAVLAGCEVVNDQSKAAGVNSPAVDAVAGTSDEGTRMITNLSQVSSAPAAIPSIDAQNLSIDAQNLVSGAAALHDQTAPSPDNAQDLADANLEHLYLSKQQSPVHGGEGRAAGDRMLLNAKARKFPEFSYAMLNQTLVAAQELEATRLEEHKLPDEIKPMILTAVMTPEGKLTDIAIERHSGIGVVDRIIIDACKKGLWTMNPPKAALADDGVFRMHIVGAVINYNSDHEGNYHYITHVGLALQ
jgi:hypothetical protein